MSAARTTTEPWTQAVATLSLVGAVAIPGADAQLKRKRMTDAAERLRAANLRDLDGATAIEFDGFPELYAMFEKVTDDLDWGRLQKSLASVDAGTRATIEDAFSWAVETRERMLRAMGMTRSTLEAVRRGIADAKAGRVTDFDPAAWPTPDDDE